MTHHPWLGLLLALVCVSPTLAQDAEPKLLRWGADKTGGAPYLYDDADGKLIGFEVELADYLASEIGRKAEFVQGDWSKLPELLNAGDAIDVVMNGYEFDPRLEEEFPSTRPYHVYTLALVASAADDTINSWEDLAGAPGKPKKRVGVLTGSAAQRYLENVFGDTIELLANDDVANVYQLVERQDQLDATVQDSVSASYFVRESKGKLKIVGQPRAPGYYVILTRPKDQKLRDDLSAAIVKGLRTGKLREIYSKYGLWTPEQGKLFYWADEAWPPVVFETTESATKDTNWPLIFEKLLRAAGTTVLLTVLSMPLAMIIGLMVAIARLYAPRVLRFLATLYVEIVRGTPLLLQLYVWFYLLPPLIERLTGIKMGDYLDPIHFAIIGLAINYSAYEAENYRAGMLAVPRGQLEAALALGMTQSQAIRRIIVPQAVRIVIPPVTNDFIALFKDTSVCSVILVTELTRQYNELYNGNRELIVELAFLTAALYLCMSYPLSLLASRLEHQSPNAKG